MTGSVAVTVACAASDPLPFTLLAQSNITGATPVSGMAGTQVTVTGSGFGATQSSGAV
jgi:hypothetical protein